MYHSVNQFYIGPRTIVNIKIAHSLVLLDKLYITKRDIRKREIDNLFH